MTGEPARDALLPGPAWLAATRFPRATFVSRSFAPSRTEPLSRVRRAHGPRRSAPAGRDGDRLPARDRVEMDGGFTLDGSVFGIGPPGADAAVQVSVRLSARRAR